MARKAGDHKSTSAQEGDSLRLVIAVDKVMEKVFEGSVGDCRPNPICNVVAAAGRGKLLWEFFFLVIPRYFLLISFLIC